MYQRILTGLAVFGQFLALFPFVVVAQGVGFGEFVWWYYIAMYAVVAVFYGCGRLCSCWIHGASFSGKIKPFMLFLSRIGVIVPIAAFIIVGALINAHAGLYLYFLPGCITAYYAGYCAVGRDYSDIFTRGWFALYFVAALLGAILISLTYREELTNPGIMQLCVSFGVMMITAAVLTNQTNIDMQTRQRSGGNAVLPAGVRKYNALLILGTGAVIVALCLFTKPVAEGIMSLLKMLVSWLVSLIRGRENEIYDYGEMDENTAAGMEYYENSNVLAQLLFYLLMAGMVLLAVKFRRQIWQFIKEIFAPLFRGRAEEPQSPFVDEFSESSDIRQNSRGVQRSERDLLKKYRREIDPVMKYRLGYELFLTRLKQSAFPQLPTDTTTAHRSKGNKAFSARISDAALNEVVDEYDRVRYGKEIPGSEALERLDALLENIR